MPKLVAGKTVASEGKMPASSAQADTAANMQSNQASASSAQVDTAKTFPGFRLAFPHDVEYISTHTSSVDSRVSSGRPRPMPDMVVETNNLQYVMTGPKQGRPISKLPASNLQGIEAPPGMDYNESYQWQLARLLEGKAECLEELPTWEHGGIHFSLSKFLSYATRHSPELEKAKDNWVSVGWLLEQNRRKMHTPT